MSFDSGRLAGMVEMGAFRDMLDSFDKKPSDNGWKDYANQMEDFWKTDRVRFLATDILLKELILETQLRSKAMDIPVLEKEAEAVTKEKPTSSPVITAFYTDSIKGTERINERHKELKDLATKALREKGIDGLNKWYDDLVSNYQVEKQINQEDIKKSISRMLISARKLNKEEQLNDQFEGTLANTGKPIVDITKKRNT